MKKFLAKWLSAHCLDNSDAFTDAVARQLTPQPHVELIEIAGCDSLASWIESPQSSLWQQVGVTTNLKQALALQKQLKDGQSLLSLDGYHVGVDWVIGLDYDEASQAGQGALSHRIRLDEIEQTLAEKNGTSDSA